MSFAETIKTICEEAEGRLCVTNSPPPVLYHYTDPAGLIGMMRTKEVWATDARFLNDSSEMTYVREIVVAAAASTAAQSAHARYLCAKLAGIEAADLYQGSIYVASFSEQRDLLSQWRAYGGDGLGYGLGFATEPNLEAAHPSTAFPALQVSKYRKVIYDPSCTGGALWDAVVAIIRLVDQVESGELAMQSSEQAYGSILRLLQQVYPTVKNEGFAEEDEWRIVFRNLAADGVLANLQFRPSSLGIATYVPLQWQTEDNTPPLIEIVMGPRIPSEAGQAALFMMMLAAGYSAGCGDIKVALTHSRVSYRR